jgi:hypothetical protein
VFGATFLGSGMIAGKVLRQANHRSGLLPLRSGVSTRIAIGRNPSYTATFLSSDLYDNNCLLDRVVINLVLLPPICNSPINAPKV